jgi:hypothetical protein
MPSLSLPFLCHHSLSPLQIFLFLSNNTRHEMWHEGLEEASRLYFGQHDIQGKVYYFVRYYFYLYETTLTIYFYICYFWPQEWCK